MHDPSPKRDPDADELVRFGYRPQLRRTIRSFSSFALSFSLISMTTGIFANFGLGLREFGPAMIWSWLVVLAGQTLVALVLAELSVHYPLSGYGYQWSARLVNPTFGFAVGWLLLLQFLTGFPGVCSAMGEYIGGYYGAALPPGLTPAWITVGLITAAAGIHLVGIRAAAWFNNAGVAAEIAGSLVLALVLLAVTGWPGREQLAVLLDTTSLRTGEGGGFAGFAVSLLVGAWCLTGFEAAADMAEETREPGRTVPRAILISLISSGLGGAVMLVAFLLAMDDLHATQASATPLADVLRARLGGTATHWALLIVFVSIFACALASLAACTRLLFSMARDRMLPGSRWLAKVDERHGAPTGAIAVVWLASCVCVLALERLELITSISAAAAYLGYAGIIWAALRGMRGKHAPAGAFGLGRARGAIGAAALVWAAFVAGTLVWPKDDPTIGSIPLRATGAAAAAGALLYVLVVRPRLRRGEAGPPRVA
jgi:amino acid transporter